MGGPAAAQTSAPPAAGTAPPGRAAGAPAAAPTSAPPAAAGGDAQKPLFVVRADKGFIDDPFTVDSEAGELLVIRTDAASFARLHVMDLASGKSKKHVELGDTAPTFERVWSVPGGKGFVVVMRDPTKGTHSAQLYSPEGKAASLVGPVTDFGFTRRGGTPVLVGWQKTQAASGDTTFTVSAYKLEGLTKIGKSATLTVSRTGEIKNPPLRFLGWQAGYTQAVVQRPGGYDKAKDIRVPDRAAVYDVLTKAFTLETEIGDVYAWAYVNDLRPKRPGRGLFGLLTDDNKGVQIVDLMGRRAVLELPVAMRFYDPSSFRDEEDLERGVLYFSLGIDPLNADALARRKRDRAFLDLYAAEPQGAVASSAKEAARYRVRRLVRAGLDERPVAWDISSGHVAILRKHKSFTRGGNELEVYALASP